MSKRIEVDCTNFLYCGKKNSFLLSELVSDMPIKNKNGEIVEEHPEVEIDENTFIKCAYCSYPISCADAVILD